MLKKNIVCIKQSPVKSPRYECEYLDLVTALASFDYLIDLVFQGDGVFSLLTTDNESTHRKRLQALPLFDVHNIWVDEDSLISRQLAKSQLSIAASPVTKNRIDTLLQRKDVAVIYV
jgi:sulfur relay protein TusC/DsrF